LDLWIGWEASSISDDQHVATLKTLLEFSFISKRCREFLHNTPKLAALRMAKANVASAPIQCHAYQQQALLGFFYVNLALRNCLQMSSFGELGISKLIELCRCLQAGWAEEFFVPHGSGNNLKPSIWVTPALRF